MKRTHHPAEALAVVLGAAMFAFSPGLQAQQTSPEAPPPPQQQTPPPEQQQQAPPDQGQQAAPGQQSQDQQQSKTFAGKIMKLQNGQYALVTGQTPSGQMAGHFLDDQDDAKKYEGKQVKVTGTLEMASNTIHVSKIEAA